MEALPALLGVPRLLLALLVAAVTGVSGPQVVYWVERLAASPPSWVKNGLRTVRGIYITLHAIMGVFGLSLLLALSTSALTVSVASVASAAGITCPAHYIAWLVLLVPAHTYRQWAIQVVCGDVKVMRDFVSKNKPLAIASVKTCIMTAALLVNIITSCATILATTLCVAITTSWRLVKATALRCCTVMVPTLALFVALTADQATLLPALCIAAITAVTGPLGGDFVSAYLTTRSMRTQRRSYEVPSLWNNLQKIVGTFAVWSMTAITSLAMVVSGHLTVTKAMGVTPEALVFHLAWLVVLVAAHAMQPWALNAIATSRVTALLRSPNTMIKTNISPAPTNRKKASTTLTAQALGAKTTSTPTSINTSSINGSAQAASPATTSGAGSSRASSVCSSTAPSPRTSSDGECASSSPSSACSSAAHSRRTSSCFSVASLPAADDEATAVLVQNGASAAPTPAALPGDDLATAGAAGAACVVNGPPAAGVTALAPTAAEAGAAAGVAGAREGSFNDNAAPDAAGGVPSVPLPINIAGAAAAVDAAGPGPGAAPASPVAPDAAATAADGAAAVPTMALGAADGTAASAMAPGAADGARADMPAAVSAPGAAAAAAEEQEVEMIDVEYSRVQQRAAYQDWRLQPLVLETTQGEWHDAQVEKAVLLHCYNSTVPALNRRVHELGMLVAQLNGLVAQQQWQLHQQALQMYEQGRELQQSNKQRQQQQVVINSQRFNIEMLEAELAFHGH